MYLGRGGEVAATSAHGVERKDKCGNERNLRNYLTRLHLRSITYLVFLQPVHSLAAYFLTRHAPSGVQPFEYVGIDVDRLEFAISRRADGQDDHRVTFRNEKSKTFDWLIVSLRLRLTSVAC